MSTNTVQANYDELEQIITCFGTWAENNAEMGARVRQNVEALINGGWEGRGAEAFFDEMGCEVLPAIDPRTGFPRTQGDIPKHTLE